LACHEFHITFQLCWINLIIFSDGTYFGYVQAQLSYFGIAAYGTVEFAESSITTVTANVVFNDPGNLFQLNANMTLNEASCIDTGYGLLSLTGYNSPSGIPQFQISGKILYG
jgi:hypothetical protein